MPKQLLVRNIPGYIRSWIEARRAENKMTQQEFLFGLLERVYRAEESQKFPLFSGPTPNVVERPIPDAIPFKFADLFAGISGFRFGLEKLGGGCVFSCEWDKYCQKTYKTWFAGTPHNTTPDSSLY